MKVESSAKCMVLNAIVCKEKVHIEGETFFEFLISPHKHIHEAALGADFVNGVGIVSVCVCVCVTWSLLKL